MVVNIGWGHVLSFLRDRGVKTQNSHTVQREGTINKINETDADPLKSDSWATCLFLRDRECTKSRQPYS